MFWESWISDAQAEMKRLYQRKRKYKLLMNALSTRYINDLEAFDDTVNRDILVRDQLDRMERAMQKNFEQNVEVRKRQPKKVASGGDIRGH